MACTKKDALRTFAKEPPGLTQMQTRHSVSHVSMILSRLKLQWCCMCFQVTAFSDDIVSCAKRSA